MSRRQGLHLRNSYLRLRETLSVRVIGLDYVIVDNGQRVYWQLRKLSEYVAADRADTEDGTVDGPEMFVGLMDDVDADQVSKCCAKCLQGQTWYCLMQIV
jgi:hypothetical protein